MSRSNTSACHKCTPHFSASNTPLSPVRVLSSLLSLFLDTRTHPYLHEAVSRDRRQTRHSKRSDAATCAQKADKNSHSLAAAAHTAAQSPAVPLRPPPYASVAQHIHTRACAGARAHTHTVTHTSTHIKGGGCGNFEDEIYSAFNF